MHGKLFVILIILAVDVRAENWTEYFNAKASEYISGCYSENFLAVVERTNVLFKSSVRFISKEKDISGDFYSVGPIVCDNENAYFSEMRNENEDVTYSFSFSDFSITKLSDFPNCYVIGRHEIGLMCMSFRGAGGVTTLGRYEDFRGGDDRMLLNVRSLGLTEGFLLSTYYGIYGGFFDDDDVHNFYKIDFDGDIEFKFNIDECKLMSYLFYKNERLSIYCDGKQKYEFSYY